MDTSKSSSIDLISKKDSPMLSKSRTNKFHKLFKSVPDNEFPIDYFSCAFLGDILLQGNLYVSQNWFCFYSRIKGRGHLLEIPMTKVISITREKTAIIFPNAIGLQTAKEKFAFGSFMSRDSTYRFLVSVWKKSQEIRTVLPASSMSSVNTRDSLVSSGSIEQDSSVHGVPDNGTKSGSKRLNSIDKVSPETSTTTQSSDGSDYSVCAECRTIDRSDAGQDSGIQTPQCQAANCRNKTNSRTVFKQSTVQRRPKQPEKLEFPYSLFHCLEYHKTKDALRTSAVKLQRIPRTSLLLAICTALVLFLLLSAVCLTYKILDLEAKLEAQGVWTASTQQDYRDKTYGSMYNLQSATQSSHVKHIQNVLLANIAILEEIKSSLGSLKSSSMLSQTATCDGTKCS